MQRNKQIMCSCYIVVTNRTIIEYCITVTKMNIAMLITSQLIRQGNTVNLVSGIGAAVKVVDSHLCGWGSIPGKSCSFFIVSLSNGLSLCFMHSDQHVKYLIPVFYWITTWNNKYIHIHTITVCIYFWRVI